MRASQRVFINTIAQYSRTIITMLLSLYTVRVVLASLGHDDFGIYSLVAGCVSMLGFITNSLIRTTQRFVNYYQGRGEINELRNIFGNCLTVHIFIGLLVVLVFEAITPLFFGGFLKIDETRISAAIIIYQFMIAMLFLTITMSPYKALLISHENIVYISVIEVLDAVIKVILVVLMSISPYDKLVLYGIIMLTLQLVNFLAYFLYCSLKYDECVRPRFRGFNFMFLKELLSFAGWQVYGTACNIGRDQGTSIVLNRSYGTIINAGWGIGVQLAGYTKVLSDAIVNAMSPQIVKAEGAGDRKRTLWLSNILSKMEFFLLSLIGMPTMFEASGLLQLWLKDYPDYSVFFCRMFIAAFMVDSMTIGLTHVNNAIGNIKKYIIIMSTPKLLSLFVVIVILHLGLPVILIGYLYVCIELVCAFVRVPLIKEQAGLDVKEFYINVILKEILPLLFCIATCVLMTTLFRESTPRLICTYGMSMIVYAGMMYAVGLSKDERIIMNGMFNSIINGIKSKYRK